MQHSLQPISFLVFPSEKGGSGPPGDGGQGGAPSNPCHPNPCLNGGSCKQNGNGFDCFCEVQYTGSLCEGECFMRFNSIDFRVEF